MKKIFIFPAILILFFLNIQSVSAHFLASDGSIGAVLHVDPDDTPAFGEQSAFYFEFKDKLNKFQPDNCDCTFEVDEDGKSIFSQPLFQGNTNPSLSNASVSYAFPKQDAYIVKVIGKPNTDGNFQPFTLSWKFHITNQSKQDNDSNNNFLGWGIGTSVALLVAGLFLWKMKKNR